MVKLEQTENKSFAPEAKEQFAKFLKDPALLYNIKKDLDRFIVGEDRNKLLLYLVCSTSFGETPLGAIITGSSSAGKSFLMNEVTKAFSNVIDFTRMTTASLDRMEQNMKGKIFKIAELHGIEAVQAKLRILISEGGLKLCSTTIGETGKIETEVLETHGTPVFLTTTTAYSIDEELLNRLFIISVDESPEQTRRIYRFQRRSWDGSENLVREQPNNAFFRELIITKVVIPYYDLLAETFPADSIKGRRDFQKLCYLISAVAYLHQHQRLIVHREQCKIPQYIVAFPADFYIAWEICQEGLKQTLMNLQKRSIEALALFKKGESLTVTDVANEMRISQNWARESLKALVRGGYLLVNREHKTHTYMLKGDNGFNGTFLENVESLKSFHEENLRNWLIQQHFNTVRGLPLSTSIHSYVHPISGESFTSVPSTVLKCYQSKPDLTINPPIKLDNTTFLDSVSLSTEFTPDVEQIHATGSFEDIELMIQKVKQGPIELSQEASEGLTRRLSTLAEAGLKLKEALEN